MDLSVIIVSYNVKYFLEQCLCSVNKAINPLKGEVLVFDNNSSDGTMEYLPPKFPFVQFIGNKENIGYARANNRALQKASGRFILFLNPDTIVAEDCFTQAVSFINRTPAAGALGIRMIDGAGNFLNESKRGFPTLWASFCKMIGLTALFPSSRFFASYYLGHLPGQKNQAVDALSGAFMLVRKEVLDKTGGFDERFFMYAEDIDLSYRIQKSGYVNFYFSESTILHFKGESAGRDARYIKLFYGAMIQFVQKHYKRVPRVLLVGFLRGVIMIKSLFASYNGKKMGNQSGKPFIPGGFVARGDVDSIKEISLFVSTATEGENIIFCTGNQFSNFQMIKEIEKQSGKKHFFIHAHKTRSIVGSATKEQQGIAWEIGPD